MSALTKLIVVESKLQRRETIGLFFGLLFPGLLLVVLGSVFPGFLDANPDLGGLRLIDIYTPIMLVFALSMVGIANLATSLAGARETGVLRRMSTTPAHPSSLLLAQLIVSLIVAMAACALAIGGAYVVFGLALPANPLGFTVTLLLLALSLFTIGLLLGAVVPSASSAGGLSTLVWMPLMVLGGLWFPREAMPAGMRRVSDLSPTGAGVQAIQDSWFGAGPALSDLLVMAVAALVVGLVAAKLFRWE